MHEFQTTYLEKFMELSQLRYSEMKSDTRIIVQNMKKAHDEVVMIFMQGERHLQRQIDRLERQLKAENDKQSELGRIHERLISFARLQASKQTKNFDDGQDGAQYLEPEDVADLRLLIKELEGFKVTHAPVASADLGPICTIAEHAVLTSFNEEYERERAQLLARCTIAEEKLRIIAETRSQSFSAPQ
jgi:hypothetical protein